MSTKANKFSKTVILPNTDFPHWVDPSKRTARDKKIQDESRWFSWPSESNKGGLFILHDGPPYANGKLHLGHAVNKISKDITVRYKILRGQKVHYVPGWDCHGLPIELKAINQKNSAAFTPLEIRYKAEKMALNTISEQMEKFQQWGITGDWSNCYRTSDARYISSQLSAFYTLYCKGMIFRDYKPIYWSPSSQTALADAELEYNTEHKSLSVSVKFPLKDIPDLIKQNIGKEKIFAAVWTTTPWTLPANQCIGFTSDKQYSLVKVSKSQDFVIVASEMIAEMQKALNDEIVPVKTFPGTVLKHATYCHPLYPDVTFPFVENQNITMTKGTGLVHMAPNHGHEDYVIAMRNDIPLAKCLVDKNGCFIEEAGKELAGLSVFTNGISAVLKLLKDYIICTEEYVHSYPYDWRSKQPIIVRSSHQWFFNTEAIKDKALSELDNVTVYPASAKKALQKAIENCPPWCISRQRAWGVPLPVFYELPERKPVITKPFIEHIIKLISNNGIHSWWLLPPEDLIPRKILDESNLPLDKMYEPGNDILDIWLDSGLSWYNVLPKETVADLYLEGVDQIRGWFQSSLWTSIALRGCPPYKSLFIHGFTVDDKGRKMSKSVGNTISPDLITHGGKNVKTNPPYGIDVLRWWVAAHACHHDNVLVGHHIIKECSENVDKLRNVFRFLLGNIHLYDGSNCPLELMNLLDRYMLHLTHCFITKVIADFDDFRYGHAARQIFKFVTNDVSAYYCHLVKDRLYCEKETSRSRQSCVNVLFHILITLIKVLNPILPHLSSEVHHYLSNKQKETFDMRLKDCNSEWFDADLPETFYAANVIREVVNENMQGLKSREMDVVIFSSGSLFNHLQLLHRMTKCTESELCELLQVSQVTLVNHLNVPEILPDANTMHGKVKLKECSKENDFTIVMLPSEMNKCNRCRRNTAKVKGELCARCLEVMEFTKMKAMV